MVVIHYCTKYGSYAALRQGQMIDLRRNLACCERCSTDCKHYHVCDSIEQAYKESKRGLTCEKCPIKFMCWTMI